ncbi:hypothetical protein T4B_15443 [Trichinella pseudospiralis]|uniref:Uncharacterized protein n=1 Tax=Trichinella pseudospiralis TaxID=6337 RepID=A0A0V1GCI9_TRIPS|nr:hypothetical protein T4B_15443 [Trichinella pseudospiralis]
MVNPGTASWEGELCPVGLPFPGIGSWSDGTFVCVGDELPDPSFWPEGNGNASDGICLLPSSKNI